MKRVALKVASLLIALMLLCTMLSTTVFAEESNRKLTIHYKHADVTFHLYRVATWNVPNSGYESTEEFAEYTGSYDMSDAGKSRALAAALAEIVTKDNLTTTIDGKTDADGTVVFSDLETGIYLVVGDSYVNEEYTYYPSPFVVQIVKDSDVTVDEKFEREKPEEPDNPDDPDDSTDDDDSEKPQTGDNTNVSLWIALLGVDSIVLIAVILLGRKKKEAKE